MIIIVVIAVAFIGGCLFGYVVGFNEADKQTAYWYATAMRYLDQLLQPDEPDGGIERPGPVAATEPLKAISRAAGR